MTSKQGFYLMFYLLDQMYWENTENDTLGNMLSSMNPDLFEGGVSADPAYWEDWQEMIAGAGMKGIGDDTKICGSLPPNI